MAITGAADALSRLLPTACRLLRNATATVDCFMGRIGRGGRNARTRRGPLAGKSGRVERIERDILAEP